MNNQRQANRLKHCGNCYLTVKGIVFEQWTDNCPDKVSALKIKGELQALGHKAIIRLIDKSFYRVYREVKE